MTPDRTQPAESIKSNETSPSKTHSRIQPPQSHSPKPALKANPDEEKKKSSRSLKKIGKPMKLNKKFQYEPQSILSGLMQFSTSKNAASDGILTDARKALALGWRRKEEEEGREGRGVFFSWL